MGSIERGKCRICGRIVDGVERKYYYYGLPCECHSPEHVELVYHCHDCTPEEPEETRITLKSGIARWLGEVWKLFNKVPLPRLRAIAEAERDGRVVIRPFKDGQDVFVISEGAVFACNIEYAGNDCIAVSEDTFYVCAIDDFCACVADVVAEKDKGITVFETRESAEAALAAGKGE